MQNLTTGVFTKYDKASFFQSDLSRIIMLFLSSVFVIYFLQPFLARIFFILLGILFWKSNKDYLWFAFIFILIDQPAGFFSGGLASDRQRLPLYTLTSGISFTVSELLIIIALIKALVKGKKSKMFFNKPLQLLFVYLILSLIFSFLYGMNIEGINRTIRVLFHWTLFISFSYLLTQKNEMIKFCFLLFPFVFLVFAGQIYEVINGIPIISIFKSTGPRIVDYTLEATEEISSVARFISAPFLNLFCFITSLFFLFSKNIVKSVKLYLYLVCVICFISVLMSATRGWFLAYTVTTVLIFFTISINIRRVISRILIPLLIFLILYGIVPAIRIQVNNAMVRISTLEGLVHGDISLGGTQKRTTERSVKVIDAFYKNPVTGWGFSHKGNPDGHVGNQNILQSTGVIGYFLFLYFWLFYSFKLNRVKQRLLPDNPLKLSLLVLIYGLVGIFIIHSTSTQIFGYDPQFSAASKIFFLVVFFVFSDVFMKEAINFDIQGSRIRKSDFIERNSIE